MRKYLSESDESQIIDVVGYSEANTFPILVQTSSDDDITLSEARYEVGDPQPFWKVDL